MLIPLACGAGSPFWLDLSGPLRFVEGFSAWALAGVILGAFVVGFVIVVGAFTISSAVEEWRERLPVPHVPNPVLEGATGDLARAVDLLRRADDPAHARPLLETARAKIARASGRLNPSEQRQLDRAWQIVRWSGA